MNPSDARKSTSLASDFQRMIMDALHDVLRDDAPLIPDLRDEQDSLPPREPTAPQPQRITRFDLDHLYDE